VALGLTLPGLMLQDSWRYAFFAAGQGQRAFVNDAIWTAALIPTMLLAGTVGTPFAFVLAWEGSALVAAVFGSWQIGLVPRAAGVAGWLRTHRDLGVRYAVENVSDGLDSSCARMVRAPSPGSQRWVPYAEPSCFSGRSRRCGWVSA
jgi:hypothetical protein